MQLGLNLNRYGYIDVHSIQLGGCDIVFDGDVRHGVFPMMGESQLSQRGGLYI